MKFDLFRRKARKEILASQELLRIQSLASPLPTYCKALLLSTLTALYCLFIVGILRTNISILFDITAILLFSPLFAFAVVLVKSNNRHQLVFKEAGMIGPYSVAFRWSEFGAYKWQLFRGTSLTANAPKDGGTTILLFSKDWELPVLTSKGSSLFATWGIFFNEEQVAKTEEIMSHFGIKKTDWFTYE